MLNSEPKASGNRNIMKFAAATAAITLLAGCAVAAARATPNAAMAIKLLIVVRSRLASARLTTIHPISF